MITPIMPANCSVSEQTADGICVGRCWHYLVQVEEKYLCPRHGDVTIAVRRFRETGRLTFESDLKKERAQ